MASARAALGKARRSMIKREKRTDVVKGALGVGATVAAFGAGQAKKAHTAWGEYEAGYEALRGTRDIQKPKFGEKGFFKSAFKGPEGEVRIGATMYDRGQIQKAGSFLGSDAAAILSPEQREQYLGRVAPGRAQTTEEIATTRESLRPDMPYIDEEFDYDTVPTESPVYQPAPPKWMKPMILQGQEPGLTTFGDDWETPQGGSYGRWKSDQSALGTTVPLPEDMSGINKAIQRNIRHQDWEQSQQVGEKGKQEYGTYDFPRDQLLPSKTFGRFANPSYARGGDFITNGPQEIIVGDNPGGRERVTVVPLDSEDIKGYYGKKHNWLEALYENNARRKKY